MADKSLPQSKPTRRRINISQNIRFAVVAMVDFGRNRAEAAQAAGIKEDTLYRALQKPEVLAFRQERLRVLRESEAARSISRVSKLADTAESEHVQLKANELLMGIEGISPVARGEVLHKHSHQVAGLVVVRASLPSAALPAGQVIDHQPVPVRRVNMIGRSVPHPSQIKQGAGNAE